MLESFQQLAQSLYKQSRGQLIVDSASGLQSMPFAALGQAALEAQVPASAGQRVALQAQASLDFAIQLLGCWHQGCLPLILGPDQNTAAFIQQLGLAAYWDGQAWQEVAQTEHKQSTRWPAIPTSAQTPASPALVLFTSGSSGQSKGVVHSHKALLANISGVQSHMQNHPPRKIGILLPLHHSFALVTQFLLGLLSQAEIVLLNPSRLAGQQVQLLQAQQIDSLAGVPTQFQMLIQGEHFPDLKQITVAGAALTLDLAQKIIYACPQADLWVGYGLTEAGPRVTGIQHRDSAFAEGSVGTPLPGIQLQIVRGELWIKSPSQMLGYLDQGPLDAEDWLKTRDHASLNQGYLSIQGRCDEILIVAGEKVAPLEIERVLSQLPEIAQIAVYGISDPLLGHLPVALILPSPNHSLEVQTLRKYCQQHLASYKHPRRWAQVSQLPLTANGKLKRKELPQWPQTIVTTSFSSN